MNKFPKLAKYSCFLAVIIHWYLDIDECEENGPCENNGTCVNTQGSYGCVCTVGWQGQHCDKGLLKMLIWS